MELKAHDIYVCVAYPPDTDTPGFAEENKTKPEECRLISETAGLFSAQQVAKGFPNAVILSKSKQNSAKCRKI